jgi:cleavage and polyadenylation specificity factor subunit 1
VSIDLGLAQIFPMTDELTGAEPKVISASFADPYLLLVRDDSSVFLISSDNHGDLDEIERGDALLATKWVSGSLYNDCRGIFNSNATSKMDKTNTESIFMFLLSAQGGLHVSSWVHVS